jgi:hypothetical protein
VSPLPAPDARSPLGRTAGHHLGRALARPASYPGYAAFAYTGSRTSLVDRVSAVPTGS